MRFVNAWKFINDCNLSYNCVTISEYCVAKFDVRLIKLFPDSAGLFNYVKIDAIWVYIYIHLN